MVINLKCYGHARNLALLMYDGLEPVYLIFSRTEIFSHSAPTGVRRPCGPYAIRALDDLPGPVPDPLRTVFDVIDQMERVLKPTVLDPSGRSLLVESSVRPTRRRVSIQLL